ncbi:MAG: filamentous hemagglutinin [Gallionellaceae bacterium]|nr:MAG: filamentous hemagglutinin [Gallionellaceae bacterium]
MRKNRKLKEPTFQLKPACVAVLLAFSFNAMANPNGGAVVNGSASFNTNGNTLTVTNTPGTIINWQGFSIDRNEITHFVQQSASSAVLNRVITNNPSVILGTLSSNGRVFLVNPGGIVFGAGSTVDVAGMVAASLNLSDADFLAGRGNFALTPGAQAVSNAGNITAQSGGEIYLIAPNVENSGVITAPNGEILLAAGREVQLVNTLDPNLRINITAPAGDATNVGQLVASAGRLGLFGTVVKNTGAVSADSATIQGGKIVFKASQRAEVGGTVSANGTSGGSVNIAADHSADLGAPGSVIHTGSIQTRGTTGAGGAVNLSGDSILSSAGISTDGTVAGGHISVQASNRAISTASAQYTSNSSLGQGGDILVAATVSNYTSGSYSATGVTGGNLTLAGNEIKLAGTQLDASGTNGGGNIHIGGLMHGAAGFGAQGVALANASNVLSNSATSIKADARQSGNGGEVVLWSDQTMRFMGNISAKGGVQSGNGGNAEISGLTSLGYGGLTDLSATNGLNGTLLLDPRNITIVAGSGTASSVYQEIIDPTPGAGEGFGGWQNIVLGNGNILISSPFDSTFGTNSGAVYLYTPGGMLISSVVGSTAGDKVGAVTVYNYGPTVLSNGNVIISSDNWDNGAVVDAGAVTWMSANGLLSTGSAGGSVSSSNSLVGSNAGDKVGSIGNLNGLTQLANGNVVISSSYWNNGGTPVNGWGAVTWMNGTNGKLSDGNNGGVVAAANSLLGLAAGDRIGFGGIIQLSGNYIVRSTLWGSGGVDANAKGAVTWMNGVNGLLTTSGTGGAVTSANSLVGSTAGDKVGTMSITQVNSGTPYTYDQSGISVGGNGNIVITSNNWNNGGTQAGAGAVTWMNGTTGALVGGGTGGTISNINSLVGTALGDKVGTVVNRPYTWLTQEASGVVWLPNGNYLVRSGQWGSGGVANAGKGAVTWGSGTAGVAGDVSSTNSIVGSTAYDLVGAGWTDSFTADPGLVVLSNSNYVVVSSQWASGTGAVTWGNGATGTSGVVSGIQTAGVAFSLVGPASGSFVGAQGITTQIGGNNFVVKSPWFDFNTNIDTGAITWVNGATGELSNSTVGVPVYGGFVSAANSLLGTYGYDNVGAVVALNNGNFLAATPVWNGGSPSTGLGAVTWLNGATGKLGGGATGGAISNTNSLVGSTAGDMSGFSIYSSIIQLGNGNILLKNPNWDNGANADVGALTWMKGATGELSNSTVGTPVYGGVIGTANSLVGSYGGVYTTSIYYPYYYYAGQEQVGSAGIDQLASGNVLVRTHNWHNPTGLGVDNAGAVTWMNGATGKLIDGSSGGLITEFNSLVGDVADSQVGNYTLMQLGNGNVVIRSPQWNLSAGAVTWMDGVTGALSDGTSFGVISAANSLIGSTANDSVGSAGVDVVTDNLTYWNYVVRSSNWSNGAAAYAGAITWVNGATGELSNSIVGVPVYGGFVSAANSLIGSTASDYIGSNAPLILGNGNVVFRNFSWSDPNVAGATYAGAVTWMNGANGQLKDASFGGVISNANSLIGSLGWDQVGSGGLTEITDGSTFWNYVVVSPYWNGSAGAVTLGNGVSGTVGVVSASNSLVGGAANDAVGSGGITLVSNGSTFWNYVVKSSSWGVGAGYYLDTMGAVTWVNGQTGQLTTGAVGGVVSSSNSLVGSTLGDQVGVASGFSGGVNIMSNGNLLIRSQYWNGSLSAMTWMSGVSGKLVGGANGAVLSASNSVLGSALNDNMGDSGMDVLQVNGNWLITSSSWGGNKGAVTWMDGTNGKLADGAFGGLLSATNSLVGSAAGDMVGGDGMCDCSFPGGIQTLSDGNYVVLSPSWNSNSGAATWGKGTTGSVGTLTSSNSVFGVQLNPNDVNELSGRPGVVLLGTGSANGGAGGVYLLGGPSAGASGSLFSDNPNSDTTIYAGWISSTLNLGTNVVLQAHNDITQQTGASISATGAGSLTLQAGRSVVLNDSINIAGTLNVTANDAGADIQIRSVGVAVIDASLATINAGLISMNNSGGDILAGSMSANTGALNLVASGIIQIGVGGSLSSSGGNITLSADVFDNASGANPFNTTGRWLIYSSDPLQNTLGGITPTFKRYNCTYAGGCLTVGTSVPTTGNGLLYAVAPTLAIDAVVQSRLYGQSDSLLTYSITSGLIDGDTASTIGLLAGTLGHTGSENVLDTHTITQGSLASSMGYGITFTGGALNITPATLTVAANSQNKVIGTPDPLLTYMTYGLKLNDSAASTLSGMLDRDVGDTIGTYSINQGNLTLLSSNYTMTYVAGTFRILAPTVVQEITQTSLQIAPVEDTAQTSEEEDKEKSAELLAEAVIADDNGQPLADPLPVCR